MIETISLKDSLDDFIRSLENFCSKSPLQPTIKVITETGYITLTSLYNPEVNVSITFQPQLDKQSQIKEIKTALEKFYPVVFDHKNIPLSKEEQEKLIVNGKPVREVLDIRQSIYLPRYKIVRVHNKYNELDVFDFKTKKMIKFKIIIPLITFLNNVFTMSKEELSAFFREKTKFMYCIKGN